MAGLSDIPAYIDVIDRVEGVISTFLNADWKGAHRRGGMPGVLGEFAACLIGHNAPEVRTSRVNTFWSGGRIEQLLKWHGVKVWDRGIVGDEFYFRVKARQAVLAEYLMLRAGVTVTSNLRDRRNATWTQGYAPGSEPPSWQQRRRRK